MAKVTFGGYYKSKTFTPEQKKELKAIVKKSNCDWDFSIHSSIGYHAMVEYVSSYIDPKNNYPIMLQAIIAYPGQNEKYTPKGIPMPLELKPVDWDIFKGKVAQFFQSSELKEYCEFCKVEHGRLFIRGKYCVLDLEWKDKNPIVSVGQ